MTIIHPKALVWAGTSLLAGWLFLGWLGIRAGLQSMDSYGIILSVNDHLRTGAYGVSRPPGHPLTEDWLLPALALLFGRGELTPALYGCFQLAGGLCCLAAFWLLLREAPLSPARRLLALACLAFSPYFLIESSDGEEFLWATAFLLLSVLLLTRLAKGTRAHPLLGWVLAVTSAVAASGCRIEFGAVTLGVVFWALLASDRRRIEKLGLAGLTLILLTLLWGPLVIRTGAQQPYAITYEPSVRFGIAIYKILFQAVGVIPSLCAALFLWPAWKLLRVTAPLRDKLLPCLTVWVPLIFFVSFFLYPTKPAMVLPGVAFLILLGAFVARSWLWAGFVVGCLTTQLIQIDCFKNRAWAGLVIKPSVAEQNYRGRPAFNGPWVDAASHAAILGKHLVIANVWPWDFTWQLAHGTWSGRAIPESRYQGLIIAYQVGPGIVASRTLADPSGRLQRYISEGYDIWIDRDLYRELFQRYDLAKPTPGNGEIDGTPCRIIDLRPHSGGAAR
jgi:hypothetical protein